MQQIRIIIINITIIILLIIVIEGIASYAIVIRNNSRTQPIAERLHSKYDPVIGWINQPNIDIPNLYGHGIYFRTNNQGFRNEQNFNSSIPYGKIRIICSGDSFTLGYGTDNKNTWPYILTMIDTCIETVNMGQGGYGIDQSYLLFKQEIDTIQFNIHIMAFITSDFYRMQSDQFLGYGKPILKLENDSLRIKNVPVPKTTNNLNWIKSLKDLRTISALGLFRQKFKSKITATNNIESNSENKETENVLFEVFKDLNKINNSKNSQLILVYLPTKSALFDHYPTDWIKFIEETSNDLEIPFINILDKVRMLPQKEMEHFFIREGQMNYPGAAGHLTNYGNDIVAKMIYKELKNN